MKLHCHAYIDKRCQSCTLIEIDYEKGLAEKIQKLSLIFPANKIQNPLQLNTIEGYRNKAKFVIGGTLDKPVMGIPSPTDKLKINDLKDCLLHQTPLNNIASFIYNHIQEFKLTPYDIATQRGEFKYLILNIARNTNEVSVRFGMRSLESFERVKKLSEKLQSNFPLIKVISFEVQPKHAAIFEGETHYLTSDKYITFDFKDFKLLGSTSNFFQINSELAHALYDKVYERYKNEHIELALDLFCGVGGFAKSMARFAKKVIGIEISENAIDCANQVKPKNVEFYCDDALKFPTYNKDPVDLLVVNPPRRGVGPKFAKLICDIAPKFFVYSSCNPDTLLSDAEILKQHYNLESLIPVDMFALTNHLEVLTFWVKKEVNNE